MLESFLPEELAAALVNHTLVAGPWPRNMEPSLTLFMPNLDVGCLNGEGCMRGVHIRGRRHVRGRHVRFGGLRSTRPPSTLLLTPMWHANCNLAGV